MDLTIRKGTQADMEQFIRLLQDVYRGMEHKEWLYLDDPQEFRQMMADGTLELWVAMDADRIAAGFDILLPGLDAWNYGYDLEFDSTALMQVVNMDTVAVHPDYRGRGLQKQLMQTAEQDIAQRGPKILLCTVHPDNTFSLNNFLAQGYTIVRKLPKYGSVRYLLRKDIL